MAKSPSHPVAPSSVNNHSIESNRHQRDANARIQSQSQASSSSNLARADGTHFSQSRSWSLPTHSLVLPLSTPTCAEPKMCPPKPHSHTDPVPRRRLQCARMEISAARRAARATQGLGSLASRTATRKRRHAVRQACGGVPISARRGATSGDDDDDDLLQSSRARIQQAMTSMDAQSSSSSSSSRSTPSSPSRSRSLMVLKTLAVFALAASLVANVEAGAARALFPARSQIPFEATGAGAGASSAAASYDEASSAAASSPSSSDVSLHRLCLPPSKAEDHWPSILTSLWALHSRHPTFDMDVWSSPRLVRHDTSEDEGGDIPALIEESSCIDFTYSSDPRAIRLLDELVHGVDRAAEVDWIILADEEEMRRRVAAQKESGIAAAAKASSSSPSAKLEDDPFHAAYHRLQK